MTARFPGNAAALGAAICWLGGTWFLAAGQTAGGQSTIVFVSTRDDSASDPRAAAEIYLMNGDGTHPRRITNNHAGDGFPALSPDGKRLVFDSDRLRAEAEPVGTSDLFVMNSDGSQVAHLIRGSSATWSPDGKQVAYHASASGSGQPIKQDPGAATTDSDIFTLNVNDILAEKPGATARNLTRNPAAINDDPDWSPDGKRIAYTSHAVTDNPRNSATAEIYVMSADGAGQPVRLTHNTEEERGPAWSPDGARIAFMCRRGGQDFELCVMNADGSNQVQLTDNNVLDATPSWSPDGKTIVFHRPVGGPGRFQLWVINADGTGEAQLTSPPGANGFPNWSACGDQRNTPRLKMPW
ncbi:MAG: hypothetical protein ACREUU_19670 [Gammaproteobacteria bacterium]